MPHGIVRFVSLRSQLSGSHETVQDLVLAAEERYWEGLELMVHQRSHAGVYLMGYAAEMLLKTACFLFDGAKPAEPAQPRLVPTKKLGEANFPDVPHESFHSLAFWAAALEYKRSVAGRPLAPPVLAALRSATLGLYDTWWVEMRYRPSGATIVDCLQLVDSVSWIRAHHTALWS